MFSDCPSVRVSRDSLWTEHSINHLGEFRQNYNFIDIRENMNVLGFEVKRSKVKVKYGPRRLSLLCAYQLGRIQTNSPADTVRINSF